MTELTQLIRKVSAGDAAARDELFATAYAELRCLAHQAKRQYVAVGDRSTRARLSTSSTNKVETEPAVPY